MMMNFSREFWIDDERNLSQVFPWDSDSDSDSDVISNSDSCSDSHSNSCYPKHPKHSKHPIHPSHSYYSIQSKNYEFESRFRCKKMSYWEVADHFLRLYMDQRDQMKKTLSKLSLDHDSFYKNIITPSTIENENENENENAL